ncbi:hypothetical protein [Sorangium sp. So ce1078]|uniref:hypothetical protein n=1 Tax=Sorangium sp. So ce1078 TaxID=3133329 RepID=UPI003F6121A2
MLRALRPLRLIVTRGVLSLSLAACARGTSLDPVAGASPGEGGGAGAGGAAEWEMGAGGGGESPGDERPWSPPPVSAPGPCSEVTHHIYAVSAYSELYSFHPATMEFRSIGQFDCSIPIDGWQRESVSPLSMAVDREGVAWILSSNGRVVRLDIATGRCEPTSFKGIERAVPWFGMAFASDGTPGQETLYVREALLTPQPDEEANRVAPTRALGVFDTRRHTLRLLGTGAGGDADLTGTGEGRLFGFVKGLPGETASLDEFNRATGARRSATPLPGVNIHSSASWAFATWGGDFYLFVSNPDPVDMITSSVYRFNPASPAPPELLRGDLPIGVIGAGVSTCAPTEVPR